MNKSDLISEQQNVDSRRKVLSEQLNDQQFVRSLPPEQDALLRRERDVLDQYSQILTERIQNFYDPKPGQVQGIAIPEDQALIDNQQYRSGQGPDLSAPKTAQNAPEASRQADTAPARSKAAQDQPVVQQKAQQQQKQKGPTKKAVQRQAPKTAPKVSKTAKSRKAGRR